MAAGVNVEGLDELRRVLRRVGNKELQATLKAAHQAAARVVVLKALPHVPARSGRLRTSVRALGSQKSGRALAGGARVPYAAAIHWGRKEGNVGSPPGNHRGRNVIVGRPFLRNAADDSLSDIEAAVLGEYRSMFDGIGLPLR